jgi:hypothetical protein
VEKEEKSLTLENLQVDHGTTQDDENFWVKKKT